MSANSKHVFLVKPETSCVKVTNYFLQKPIGISIKCYVWTQNLDNAGEQPSAAQNLMTEKVYAIAVDDVGKHIFTRH